jgi:hypothetical protein
LGSSSPTISNRLNYLMSKLYQKLIYTKQNT